MNGEEAGEGITADVPACIHAHRQFNIPTYVFASVVIRSHVGNIFLLIGVGTGKLASTG